MRSQPPEESAPQTFLSRLEMASTLSPRAPISLPPLPTSAALFEPTSIFVGISPEGGADYVFLTQSSGNTLLDQKAQEFIRTLRFKPDAKRSWGVLTLHWGGTSP